MSLKFRLNSLVFSTLFLSVSFSGYSQSLLDKRINDLVDAMTTQEKIDQLINNSFGGTPSNTRLGIPGFYMDDGPHGLRLTTDRNGRTATAFPTGVAMASTWDEDIALKVGEAMGVEFWAFNRSQQLGPCVDICRDPRGGRTAESGGEDSYLAGHIGKAVAIGIQKSPIVATVKHFMGESKQENRHYMNVLASDRWLMDFAGYNFRTVVQEAGVLSLMGSYNKINDDKGCESYHQQTTILRERWGYPFYVVSDWEAIFDSKKAIKAGTDICMGSNKYANDLPVLVANGEITIADLDRAVKHVLRTKILNGILDYFPYGNTSYAKTPEINAINKLAAQKSVILLKNEKKSDRKAILPLKKTGIKIALIGPNATAENLNCFGSSATFPPYAVSVKQGIERIIGAENLSYTKGCDINSPSTYDYENAKSIAAKADIVIFAGGLDDRQEGEGFSYGIDRKGGSIELPGMQQDLINQLASVNPNLVVVLQSGGICSLPKCISNIKGLIYSFYAAQEAGSAIGDVLFGNYNPAGRLVQTMPKKDSDFPDWEEENFRKFTQNLDGGYRWFDEKNIKPEFAFGFGLSYTTFAYSNLIVSDATIAGQPITVSVDIKNIGSISGEEVAQLYISSPSTPELWMPKKQLRGFKRISLKPGEMKTVTFHLCADDFYFWNGTQYQAQSGNFVFRVGGSSDNLPLTKKIKLKVSTQKPDLKITQIYTMPRYPIAGQEVSFYALVKNQGNASNTADSPYKIDFKINGKKVAAVEKLNTVIAPGQVQLLASTGVWSNSVEGKYELSGELNFDKGTDVEWDATNNIFEREFEVFNTNVDPKVSNLAYKKPVTCSSDFAANKSSEMVDGDMSSRWESGRSDNEWSIIDLKAIAKINRISIVWEAAYAKNYKIECSVNGTDWTLLKEVTNGTGGTESYSIDSIKARYIKTTLTERTPIENEKYGFSIYEYIVNGDIIEKFPNMQIAQVAPKLYLPYAKTILDGTLSGDALKKEKLEYLWTLESGSKDAEIDDIHSPLTLVKFKTAGTYVFKLTGTNSYNNSASALVTVQVQKVDSSDDLAIMKPATSSGIETSDSNAEKAVDGISTTRWSSSFSDNQWWQVDLQHQVLPTTLKIDWEGAYSSVFNVQISDNGNTWKTLYANDNFNGGTSEIVNDKSLSGRFLRVNCIKRKLSDYGNSFFTFAVNGSYLSSKNNIPMAVAGSDMISVGSCSLNGSKSCDKDADQLSYKWEQLAGPGTVKIENASATIASVTGMKPGDYYFRLSVDDGKDIDFDVVKVVVDKETSAGINR